MKKTIMLILLLGLTTFSIAGNARSYYRVEIGPGYYYNDPYYYYSDRYYYYPRGYYYYYPRHYRHHRHHRRHYYNW